PYSSIPLSLSHNTPPTSAIYPLSLHDALPISRSNKECRRGWFPQYSGIQDMHRRLPGGRAGVQYAADPLLHIYFGRMTSVLQGRDRKSTRLNSSHVSISYAVFCLKKKNSVKNQ